jgi:hypothetical protein
VGANGAGIVLAAGGAGLSNGIRGSAVTYSPGGQGAPTAAGNRPVAGDANTGGGGGGGGTGSTGTAGSSGVVVLRYSSAYPAATSTTGGPTITLLNGFRIYSFIGSGSITF